MGPHPVIEFLGDLAANLYAGARLALFAPARAPRLRTSLGQLAAVMAVLWAIGGAADYLESWPHAAFSLWGLTAAAASDYFWLASVAVIVLIDRRPRDFIALCTTSAVTVPPIWIVWLVVQGVWTTLSRATYDSYSSVAWWGLLAWQAVVFWRVLRTPYGAPSHRAAGLAGVYAALLYANLSAFPEQPIFYASSMEPERPPIDVETTYYRQPGLVGGMLDALRPGRPGEVELYFVGFGGYADQDVFMRETRQVRALFDRRLGTAGRSAVLINNPRTIGELPLANRHNLEQTITGIARTMNLEEDVLVLFLTSHGAQDASVAVDFSPLGLTDLRATDLRAMLDDAGIRWRVILVSACFSGSFIEPLATPGTLIIAAAAADRTSFGCAHHRDWTYFGEAFFRDSLPYSASFTEAFDRARVIIEKREATEGIDASRPQISVGRDIEARLPHWPAEPAPGAPVQPSPAT